MGYDMDYSLERRLRCQWYFHGEPTHQLQRTSLAATLHIIDPRFNKTAHTYVSGYDPNHYKLNFVRAEIHERFTHGACETWVR